MSKEKRKPRPEAKRLSLHPLSLEQALKGAMETGPLPESPRQRKPKKRVKKPPKLRKYMDSKKVEDQD